MCVQHHCQDHSKRGGINAARALLGSNCLITKNVAQVLPRYFVDVGFLQIIEIKFQMNSEVSHGIEFIAQISNGFSRISNCFS